MVFFCMLFRAKLFKRIFVKRGYLSEELWTVVSNGIWEGPEAGLHALKFLFCFIPRFRFLRWKVTLVWEWVQTQHQAPTGFGGSAWFQGRGGCAALVGDGTAEHR